MKYKINYTINQIGGTLPNLNVLTYNVYGGGKFKDIRSEYIINTIFRDSSPDIICLQEVTYEILDMILKKNPRYYLWTKIDAMKDNNITLTDEDLNKTKKEGFIAILSKWKFLTKELVNKGSWFDDGIMKTILDTKTDLGYNLVVYNVHTIGGTYGKSEEIVLKKREKRIKELKSLRDSINMELNRNIIIMGDFNSDSNDPDLFPEIKHYPENQIEGCFDVWKSLYPKLVGATESHKNNLFRAYLKPKQNREARFDKVIYYGNNINPESIEMIGNKKVKEIKDDDNITVELFPSDHFGLKCSFTNIN